MLLSVNRIQLRYNWENELTCLVWRKASQILTLYTLCSSVRMGNKFKADFYLSQTIMKNMTICLPVNVSWSSNFLAGQMSLATCLPTVATMRPLLFWIVTQRMLVGVYRCFKSANPSHLQGSRVNCLTLEDGTEGLSRNIGKQSPTYAAQTQKIKGLIYKQWKPEFCNCLRISSS
jgi:hypothetical protein